jgi:uncharacterized protein YeaO (DUF488 family)
VTVTIVRVYEDAGAAQHCVLVDRLWPRGVRRDDLGFDEWLKDVAPSDALRKWYSHDPARFAEFARRYRAELRRAPAAAVVERLAGLARRGELTLLTATRDVEHSGAAVLRAVIETRAARSTT